MMTDHNIARVITDVTYCEPCADSSIEMDVVKRYDPKHHNSYSTVDSHFTKVLSTKGERNRTERDPCPRAPTAIRTLDKYPSRSKCYQYQSLLRKVKGLLEDVNNINKSEGSKSGLPVCVFCKKYNVQGNCRRCQAFSGKKGDSSTPVSVASANETNRQNLLKMWAFKVKKMLCLILEGEVCQHKAHKIHKNPDEVDELTRLLNELKVPLHAREMYIARFPSIESLENITESKVKLENVLLKLKCEKHHHFFGNTATDSDSHSQLQFHSPMCPLFSERQSDKQETANYPSKTNNIMTTNRPDEKSRPDTAVSNKASKGSPSKLIDKKDRQIKTAGTEKSTKISKVSETDGTDKQNKKTKNKSSKRDSQNDMFSKLLKAETQMTKDKHKMKEEKIVLPPIKDLPDIKPKIRKKVEETLSVISESFIECQVKDDDVVEMVKGNNICPIQPRLEHGFGEVKPLLYNIVANLEDQQASEYSISNVSTPQSPSASKKPRSKLKMEPPPTRRVISYMLSDKEFIEKGWTVLPVTKVIRRMNIYKMVPPNPEYDWFEKNKDKRIVLYDTGEKLAEIQEDGKGQLFYKNGMLALDYCPKDSVPSHRYTVYSTGESDFGRNRPATVLASFDYQGNGIVFDHSGNERLKYNQSEGEVIDPKIGAPGRWKWHVLNEPPVLQTVLVDTHVKMDPCIKKLSSRNNDDSSFANMKRMNADNIEMAAIELDNYMKEKELKLLQKFQPFKIKTKAMKLNDQFSLKVLDQSNIYLMFRDGLTSIKFDVGFVLISNEIVDTDMSDVTNVATPYDRMPPKSQSVADLQNILHNTKRYNKMRKI